MIKYAPLYSLLLVLVIIVGCGQERPGNASVMLNNHSTVYSTIDSTMAKVYKTKEEWKKELTFAEYRVLRGGGTELPIVNEYNKTKSQGVYHCAACDLPIFHSQRKYDSGSGWPAFYAPVEESVTTRADNTFFMKRTEVLCSRCDSHLGHVFEDGPEPTGLRYCINSVAMNLRES
ncbi:MAG: peptide-methionine (R)-S-oxide reductase MsrB [Balneolales bacterium]